MNYGKLFWGTVLPFSVILLIISILAMTDMFGEESGLSLAGAVFSLFGGLAGGLSAFFIAREQIRHQESSKVIDLKIQKFDSVVSQCETITQCLFSYRDLVKEELSKYGYLPDSQILHKTKEDELRNIKQTLIGAISNIYKAQVYLRMINIREPDIVEIFDIEDQIIFTESQLKQKDTKEMLRFVDSEIFYIGLSIGTFQMKIEEEIVKLMQ